MDCQFSEDNYKGALNFELMSEPGIFIPSQPREKVIGFDAAFFSRNPRFWRMWSLWWPFSFIRPPRRGVELDPDLYGGLEHDIDASDFPANFRANIFIQYKRPDYLSTNQAPEYEDWGRPYFRYYIEPHQQNVLEHLEISTSNNALVVYACPAFWQHDELFQLSNNGRLIENSNFTKPSTLSGHHKYTFVNGGLLGKAFSEPEDVPKISLMDEISKLKELPVEKKNSQFIKSLSTRIIQTVEKTNETFKTAFNSATTYFETDEKSDLVNSISKIHSFLYITNLSWVILYKQSASS